MVDTKVLQNIQNWVQTQLQAPNIEALNWQALSGDASFRQYFRCNYQRQRYIIALAPPATEKNHEFVLIADLLRKHEVKAPAVIAVDYQQGYILQQDFGNTLLSDVLSPDSVDQWYAKAMAQLLQMRDIAPIAMQDVAIYDAETLKLELSYFNTWFLQSLLNYHCDAQEDAVIEAFFDELVHSALAQPQGFVHRDYHCRNIMVCDDNSLATIDFQDALFGPLCYDLVSILRDCYVVWPEDDVQRWLAEFWHALVAAQHIDAERFSLVDMQQAFDLMGLQRHIKVLGIFARLSIRDNKHGYLQDLPVVVNYVSAVLNQLVADSSTCTAASKAFKQWFDEKIMPLVEQQPWSIGQEQGQ